MDGEDWVDEAWIDEVLESPSHLSHRESRREKPPAEAEVIDVDADDATLAEQLSKTLNQAEVLGLATLQAARKRRAERRSAVPAHADVVDVDDEASTDLLHEQRQRLPAFLRENERQLPVTDIAMNPHSLPGTPLYERFFAAWAQVPNKSASSSTASQRRTSTQSAAKASIRTGAAARPSGRANISAASR